MTMKDVYLHEIDSKMTDFHLQITPFTSGEDIQHQDASEVNLEVIFDPEAGLITLEMHDIFVDGSGMIQDPESKNLEVITFRGPITTANVVLRPEEEIRGKGDDMYPKFSVEEVTLKVD